MGSPLTGRSGKPLSGFLCLFLAGNALALAGGAAESRELNGRLNSPFVSGWTAADFNGDHTIDVARSRALARDGAGYTQQVLVQLGDSQTSFAFRSRSAKVQLGARDIDGDKDRDIVVLEALSMVPIGVWLNDGAGNFSEGNLADFQAAVDTRGSKPLDCQPKQWEPLFGISEQRIEPSPPCAWLFEPDGAAQAFSLENGAAATTSPSSGVRSRAPPRLA